MATGRRAAAPPSTNWSIAVPQSRHFIAAYLAVIAATVWLAHGHEVDDLMVSLLLVIGALLACALAWRWEPVAWLLSRDPVRQWIYRTFVTPERAFPIHDPDGKLYMDRYVVFNRGGGTPGSGNDGPVQYPWLPFSIRLHCIRRPDSDRHPHDHPCVFRSFCLEGMYRQKIHGEASSRWFVRGDTQRVGKGMFHRITWVTEPGVWTLVIFGRRTVTWGFLVDGHKVPSAEYLGE
jgi:hypothetical protein